MLKQITFWKLHFFINILLFDDTIGVKSEKIILFFN